VLSDREGEGEGEKEGQSFGDERLIEKDKFDFFSCLRTAFHYCITLQVFIVLNTLAAVAVVVTSIQGLYTLHICCSHKCK
jgi:hypothetical protein